MIVMAMTVEILNFSLLRTITSIPLWLIQVYFLVNFAIKNLQTPIACPDTKIFTLEKPLSSVTSVSKRLSANLYCLYIKDRIPERNHMHATFVGDHLRKNHIWFYIIEHTQAKNHTSVACVKKSSHQPVVELNIHADVTHRLEMLDCNIR